MKNNSKSFDKKKATFFCFFCCLGGLPLILRSLLPLLLHLLLSAASPLLLVYRYSFTSASTPLLYPLPSIYFYHCIYFLRTSPIYSYSCPYIYPCLHTSTLPILLPLFLAYPLSILLLQLLSMRSCPYLYVYSSCTPKSNFDFSTERVAFFVGGCFFIFREKK